MTRAVSYTNADGLVLGNGKRLPANNYSAALEAISGQAIIPHRGGGANVAPDNEMQGFDFGISCGFSTIDVDVQVGSDGTPVVIHDTTIQGVTTGSGNVSSQNLAAIRALTTDPSNYMSAAGWANGSVSTLDDVCRKYGNRVAMLIEAKNSVADGNAVLSCLRRHNIRPEMAIVSAFDPTYIDQCINAGYPIMRYYPSASTPVMSTQASLGVNAIAAAADWTMERVHACHTAGMLAGMYNVDLRVNAEAFWAMGGDFIISDDPVYVSGAGLQREGNQFAGGYWPNGVIPFATTNGGRGRVTADGKWQQTQLDVNARTCVLGFLGVTSATEAWQLDFTLGIDTSRAANANYSLWIGCPTDAARTAVSGSYGTGGVLIALRRNQNYEAFSVDGPSTLTSLGSVAGGSALSGTGTGSDADGDKTADAGSGTPYAFRITLNPLTGTLTVANITSPHASGTLTITNAALVGLSGYIHAGRNNITSTIHSGFQLT